MPIAQKAISIGVKEYLLKPLDYDELKNMAARLAEEIRAKKEEQQEVRDLQKYFNQSVPELRSKFAGNLLYGRLQGKGVVQEQAKSLKLTIEKYIVCVGRKDSWGKTLTKATNGLKNLPVLIFLRKFSTITTYRC